ncbi:hypothetical protein DY000_02039733 [Brassica cretica]|uniref:Uncharacterized protein n=1 Tax=Brassica cretica TaxID=69181 RepID=A0ABQ7BN69_BRACR|nr:hypothetical protein DY000_02039733 [Brassica cretica]
MGLASKLDAPISTTEKLGRNSHSNDKPPQRQATHSPLPLSLASYDLLANERNARLHSNTLRSVDLIYNNIYRQLKNKIQSFRPSNPSLSTQMMQLWI